MGGIERKGEKRKGEVTGKREERRNGKEGKGLGK